MNYKQILENIRKKYHLREVSAFVGAGFSKNIAKEYPSWQQLLYDMVVWLYKNEIEQSYTNHLHLKRNVKNGLDKKAFEEDIVRKIIDREGYLDIVSQYIKKKGFREAIEVYIEERIPSVRKNEKDLFIAKDNKSIPINPDGVELYKIFLDGFWENIFTTNYDHLLEYVSNLTDKQWKKYISNDYELTSGNNKSIIKIHGHLRDMNDNAFGFDNDFSIRYIISKEDYEAYPCKHEAFTQLMRISLLKGIFCLFGFSGDDPNFLAWVKWVRDIIVKNPSERIHDSNNSKIFLISLDEKAPSRDKLQFYKNHKIEVVPLKNEDVKKIIGVPFEEQSPIILFKHFFYYIYNIDGKRGKLIENESYSSLWTRNIYDKRYTPNKQFEYTINLNESDLKNIIENKVFNRLVKNTYFQDLFLSDLNHDVTLSTDIAKLAIIALEDTFNSIQWYPQIEKNISSFLLDSDDWKHRFTKLEEREKTLSLKYSPKHQSQSPIYYENVLRAAFTLNFKELKSLLIGWNPTNEDEQKRAGFYSTFDTDKAISLLNSYIEKEIEEKEKNYAQQQLDYLAHFSLSYYATESIIEYRDILIKNLSKPKNIKPYGYRESNDNEEKRVYKYSFRLLQFLIETGWQNSRNGVTFITAETLYEAFTNLLESYPYPVLYYILQYDGHKDILRRFGQDIAYSDTLQTEIPSILDMLFSAYFSNETPKPYKRSILWIMSELLIAVKPIRWNKCFMQIWRNDVSEKWPDLWGKDHLNEFIESGLPYLDVENSKQIIIDCIIKRNDDTHTNKSIEYLYYHYDSLKRNKAKLTKDVELKQVIDSFIENINTASDFGIAGNIYDLLTSEQINNIAHKIEEVNSKSKFDSYNLRTMSFFAERDSEICKIYKKIILNSPYLWHNGINSDQSGTPPKFIKVDKISKKIKWKTTELVSLYTSLCDSFQKLTSSRLFNHDNDSFFSNKYVSLLDEMYLFLVKNEKQLKNQPSYNQIKAEVENSYTQKRGFKVINDALVSNDDSIVVNGVDLLFREIELYGWGNYSKSLNLLINRVVFKNKSAFLYCLSSITYLLKNYPNEPIVNSYITELQLMSDIYQDKNIVSDMRLNKAQVYYFMIKIAQFLHKKDIVSESITFWLNLQKAKRFNNLAMKEI